MVLRAYEASDSAGHYTKNCSTPFIAVAWSHPSQLLHILHLSASLVAKCTSLHARSAVIKESQRSLILRNCSLLQPDERPEGLQRSLPSYLLLAVLPQYPLEFNVAHIEKFNSLVGTGEGDSEKSGKSWAENVDSA